MDEWHLIVYAPAYNVESSISEFIERMNRIIKKLAIEGVLIKKFVILNDGSTDGTLPLLNKLKDKFPFLKIINKKKNEGPAAAIFDAMEAASKLINEPKTTILIRMDSDLEHNPEDIPLMIKPIIENSAKIVAGCVPFDSRSGYLVTWFNKQIGLMENTKYLNKKIPQFCPGFNAIRGDLYLKLLPLLNKKRVKFIETYKKDMLTVDFVILAVAYKLGNEIHYVHLSSIGDKWIKKIPISKIASYFDYHNITMDFLKKNL